MLPLTTFDRDNAVAGDFPSQRADRARSRGSQASNAWTVTCLPYPSPAGRSERRGGGLRGGASVLYTLRTAPHRSTPHHSAQTINNSFPSDGLCVFGAVLNHPALTLFTHAVFHACRKTLFIGRRPPKRPKRSARGDPPLHHGARGARRRAGTPHAGDLA